MRKKTIRKVKAERAELEKHDVEIKKQFAETEEKIKGLPDAIKQRIKGTQPFYKLDFVETEV